MRLQDRVRLLTWCDSTDLYLRECSITLGGVKERREEARRVRRGESEDIGSASAKNYLSIRRVVLQRAAPRLKPTLFIITVAVGFVFAPIFYVSVCVCVSV